MEVVDFPAIVINDIYGGDLYQEGQAKWNELDKQFKYLLYEGTLEKGYLFILVKLIK